jgi:hypothetical protein
VTRASLREYAAVQRERNPLHLRRQLDRELDRLWALAAPEPHRLLGQTSIATPLPTSRPGGPSALPSVTTSFELTRTGA